VRYLLDANVCARYLNGRAPAVRTRIRSTRREDIVICSIVKAELFYGAMRNNDIEGTLRKQQQFLNLFVSLPFDDAAALIYGRIRADLTALDTPIGPNDFQIVAIAMANNLVLVTHNTGEFSRVSGLLLEDWEEQL
jgi:tRNA(fMet)-specific endonuclease VapC